MHPTYYDLTVPFFTSHLESLAAFLKKGEETLKAKGMSDEDILKLAIHPDMFPLVKQIQIATDNAKGACTRLADISAPVFEDTETALGELYTRIEKTIAFLGTLSKEQFDGAAERTTVVKYYPGKHFNCHEYLMEYGIPNFLFHVTTAYCILRKEGVAIGKADFLGKLSLHDD